MTTSENSIRALFSLANSHFLGGTNAIIAVQIKTKFCSFYRCRRIEGHQGLDTKMLSLWRKFDFASNRGCMLNYVLKDMNDTHANNCKYNVFGLYLSTILKQIRCPIHCVATVVLHLNFYFSFFLQPYLFIVLKELHFYGGFFNHLAEVETILGIRNLL